jgi:ferredoxin-NADP reductase
MSERYSYLKVTALRTETPKAYSLVLEQPNPPLPYKPGQFFTFILRFFSSQRKGNYIDD